MAALSNYRHELFAFELASGKTATESYALAGYKHNPGNAQRLKQNEQIRHRVTQLQHRGNSTIELTRADILNMVLEDRKGAIECNQYAVALKADDMLGRELHNMFVEKKEIGLPGDFAQLQSAQDILESAKAQLGNELAERLMHVFMGNTIDNDAQAPALTQASPFLIETSAIAEPISQASQANGCEPSQVSAAHAPNQLGNKPAIGCEPSALPDLAQLEQTDSAQPNSTATQRHACAGKADSSS